MRKLAIAVALATTGLATPAVARDNSGYVGVEAGGMIVENFHTDYRSATLDIDSAHGLDFHHHVGFDGDVIGGWDFGSFRVEGELAYKHAGIKEIGFGADLQNEQFGGFFDSNGHVNILSGMINGLVDFGDAEGWSGYVGGGLGLASVKYSAQVDDPGFGIPGSANPNPPITTFDLHGSDSGVAWQLIAGVRMAVTDNIDIGLKYRYFHSAKLRFGDVEDEAFDLNGRLKSHSLLLGVIYNFTAPPPPPPPPATQTCPDGSVILATDVCPAPPPPPPPPPPAPERGL